MISSTKQEINSRRSTEGRRIATDNKISKIMLIKRFVEHQGFKIKKNKIYQNNTNTINLENNGKVSSGKRTRHFDIRLFYITNLMVRHEVEVKYYPADEMLADYIT